MMLRRGRLLLFYFFIMFAVMKRIIAIVALFAVMTLALRAQEKVKVYD